MKLLDASINWNDHEHPKFYIRVDRKPQLADLVFKARGNIYTAERDGFIACMMALGGCNSIPAQITVQDEYQQESILIVQDPIWVRSGFANSQSFEHKMLDVMIAEGEDSPDYLAGKITLEYALHVVRMLPGISIIRVQRLESPEYIFIPVRLGLQSDGPVQIMYIPGDTILRKS